MSKAPILNVSQVSFILMTATEKGSIGRKSSFTPFQRLICVFNNSFKEKILACFKGKGL